MNEFIQYSTKNKNYSVASWFMLAIKGKVQEENLFTQFICVLHRFMTKEYWSKWYIFFINNIVTFTVQYCDCKLKNTLPKKYCTFYQMDEYSNSPGSSKQNTHSYSL